MRPIAFLDRDGTLNQKAPEGQYTTEAELKMIPGSAQAVAMLSRAGYINIVVSNQQGIAKGLLTHRQVERVNQMVAQEVQEAGGQIEQFLFCPHLAGTCQCRKPKVGMLEEVKQSIQQVDWERSVLIGDAITDMQAAKSFGIRGIRVGTKDIPDLKYAVTELLQQDPA